MRFLISLTVSVLLIGPCILEINIHVPFDEDDFPGSKYKYAQDNEGNYNYNLSLFARGRMEQGTVVKSETGQVTYRVNGTYYFADNGTQYETHYVADSNGYKAITRIYQRVTEDKSTADRKGVNGAVVKTLQGR